ncbi:hypothetical protein ABZT28_09495 [Streptomyces sp. NPDC005388]|uniref:hypothetical protein n=1 Tax=Streptomyces sp. NPDC005388 TaxID=3156717 RepID=UPI0033A6A2FB
MDLVRRLLAVNFVPSLLPVGCLWTLVRAGSYSGPSDWSEAIPSAPISWIGTLLGVVVCTCVLALLLHPFQVRAVRVLEGYWDRWPTTARLAGVLTEIQRRRREALRTRSRLVASEAAVARVSADARRRLAARPPADVLLPTALGNALRTGEITAGERYGLTTLTSWPRIYMQLSPRMIEALRSTRDALDTAVNLCWSFLAVGILSGVAVYDEPGSYWLPAGMLIAATVAYKGAVITAQTYSGLMHVVYDLHRFDLLEALHHQLPTKESEREVFEKVSDTLAGEWVVDLSYEHRRAWESRVHDADGAADAQ